MRREDARAALTLASLAAAGLVARWALTPSAAAPGDVQLARPAVVAASLDTSRAASARLARPLGKDERIDLDRADASELTRLPRIGPVLAQRIVADRDKYGPFRSLAEFDRVRGIGPKLLEAIRPHAAFSGIPARPKSLDSP